MMWPNIILCLSDDQDKLDFGCYSNPNVKTSNVDKLASEGIKFNNFIHHKQFVHQAVTIFTECIQLKTDGWPITLELSLMLKV